MRRLFWLRLSQTFLSGANSPVFICCLIGLYETNNRRAHTACSQSAQKERRMVSHSPSLSLTLSLLTVSPLIPFAIVHAQSPILSAFNLDDIFISSLASDARLTDTVDTVCVLTKEPGMRHLRVYTCFCSPLKFLFYYFSSLEGRAFWRALRSWNRDSALNRWQD